MKNEQIIYIIFTEPSCRPQFAQDGPSVLEFEELRHPCVTPRYVMWMMSAPKCLISTHSILLNMLNSIATDFIPNDTYLGCDKQNIILLTGPNMGGKSTFLRQVRNFIIYSSLHIFKH